MEKAIITAASNKFFPSLINLLGSIKANYPNHPKIYIYDLGLFWSFRKELEQMENVAVLEMPHFCPFWRQCYTWKTYILSHPFAKNNLYLDAGNQVLRPLDDLFAEIEADGYLAVGQITPLAKIVPQEYKEMFKVEENFYLEQCITAGVFGFGDNKTVKKVTKELFEAAIAGLCLGFSKSEQHRNRGINKTQFVRNCEIFRHDTTLLSVLMRKYFGVMKVRGCMQYAGPYSNHDHSLQYLWNMRLSYKELAYLRIHNLQKKPDFTVKINRMVIGSMLLVKKILIFLK